MEIKTHLRQTREQKQIDKLAKKYKDKKIVFYGAGVYAKALIETYDLSKISVIGISDQKFGKGSANLCFGYKTIAIDELKKMDFDLLVLLVQEYKMIKKSLKNELFTNKTNKEIKIVPLIKKGAIQKWWDNFNEKKINSYGVLSRLGGSFKEYLVENNMKEIIAQLKEGLDEKSIDVVDRSIKKILHLPDSKYSYLYFSKPSDLERVFGTIEDKISCELYSQNLEAYKKRYPLARPEYNIEVFLYHHGLYFANKKIQDYLKDKDFVDVGAYIGESALTFMDYSPRKVYSFEMSSKNGQDYIKTMNLNKISEDKYELLECAVSNCKKTISIFDTGKQGTNILRSGGDHEVECIDVDSFAEEKNLKVGLIKTDVEGHGIDVLQGMRKTIQKDRPILSLGIYHSPVEFFETKPLLEEIVKGLNYKITIEEQRPYSDSLLDTVIFAYPDELQ